MPLDQRPMFSDDATTTRSCTNAAAFLDGILAVALTRQEGPTHIRLYTATITEEVAKWVGA